MEVGRVSLIVEVDGKVCAVTLPQNRLKMLVTLAANLSDNGALPVVELGSEYTFEPLIPEG